MKKITSLLLILIFTFKIIPLKANTTDLVKNGDFNGSASWNAYKGWDGGYVSISNDGYEGSCVKIINPVTTGNPWVGQGIGGIIPGAEYKVSAYMKTSPGVSGIFKTELLDINANSIKDTSYNFEGKSGAWTFVSFTFTAPENCQRMSLLARIRGKGEIYFDKISMIRTDKEAPYFFMISDNAFYYGDDTMGSVRVRFNTVAYEIPTGSLYRFYIKDKSTTIKQYSSSVSKNKKIDFYLSDISTLGKEYTLVISLENSKGEVLFTDSETVYKYKRPDMFSADGVFTDFDGNSFYPTFGYHVPRRDYGACKEAGINVIQYLVSKNNTTALLQALDEAEKNNVYLMLNLYADMLPAGHPDNAESTELAVKAAQNHKALFGYMLMDEPFLNAKDDKQMYKWLKDSYKLIRDLDPKHPIYVVECVIGGFEMASNCSDVFAIDPYPASASRMPSSVYNATIRAVEVTNKPVFNIIQSYNLGGYEPSSNDIRHMAYQSFFAGAKGVGYYPINDSDSTIWDVELLNGVVGFNKLELEIARKAFNTSSVISKSVDKDGICYVSYKDQDNIYAIAINKSNIPQTVSIPVNTNGYVTCVNGSFNEAVTVGGNLTFDIGSLQAVCYKISQTKTPEISLWRNNNRLYKLTDGQITVRLENVEDKAVLTLTLDDKLQKMYFISGSSEIEYKSDLYDSINVYYWDFPDSLRPYTKKTSLSQQ